MAMDDEVHPDVLPDVMVHAVNAKGVTLELLCDLQVYAVPVTSEDPAHVSVAMKLPVACRTVMFTFQRSHLEQLLEALGEDAAESGVGR